MTTWMRPLLTLELWLPCDSCKPRYTATLHQPRHPHRALVCRLSRRSSRLCVVATVVTKGKRRRRKWLRWCRRCRSVPASTPTHTRHTWRRPHRRWVGVLELHPHLCRHPRAVRCPWLDPNVGSPLHAGRELAARHPPHPCTCVGAGHDVCLCLCVRVCLCLCGRACVCACCACKSPCDGSPLSCGCCCAGDIHAFFRLRTAWRTPAPNEFSSAGSGGGNQLPPSSPSASKIPRTYSGATVEDAPLPNSSTSARSRDIALLSSGGEGSGDADADVDVEEGVDAAEAALEAMQAAEAALANSPAVPRRLQRPSGDGDDGAKAGEHDNGSQPPQPEAEAKKEPEEEPPAVDDNKPILQGYLRKEGRTRGSWKRRWFVMRRRVLHYLKRPDSARAQGSISLVPTVDPPTDTCEPGAVSSLLLRTDTETYPQPFCFQLVTPSRVYALQAPSKVAMVHWMAALTAALEDLREEAEGNAKTAAATAAEAAAKRRAEEAEKKAEAARAKALQRVEKRRLDAEKAAKAAQARAAAARAKAQAEAAARKAAEDAKYPTPGSPAAEQAHAAARAIAQAVAKGQVPATGASVAPSSSGSRRGSRSSRGSSPRSDGGGKALRMPTHGGKDDGPVELTDANRALWSMPSDIPAGVNVVVQETYGNRARGGRTGQRGGDTSVAELPVQGRRLSQYSTGLPENTGNTKKTAACVVVGCGAVGGGAST